MKIIKSHQNKKKRRCILYHHQLFGSRRQKHVLALALKIGHKSRQMWEGAQSIKDVGKKAEDPWVTGGAAEGRLGCGRELQELCLSIGCVGRTENIAEWREAQRQHC